MNTRQTEIRTVADNRARAAAAREYAERRDERQTVPTWVAWALMLALSLLLTAAALAFAVYLPAMWGVLS